MTDLQLLYELVNDKEAVWVDAVAAGKPFAETNAAKRALDKAYRDFHKAM